ncbi:MAG: hypothetical protein M0Z41_06695 [Peptococcaceae bacterium]|jgi:photosystem II stability/assembly factor-like uncharacterized protein|nr:hypothetical protein [Peptococcaceae bacterium]
MKRFLAALAAVAAALFFVAGCGPETAQNGQTPAEGSLIAVLPSTVPFSQLKAPALDTVDFVSDAVGYAGGRGIILKSADGGRTWAKVYTSRDNVLSVDAVNAVNVWAATKDYLLRSTDGRTFRRVDPAISAGQAGKGITAIDFLDKDQGFILANGVIWRLTGGAKVQMATPKGRVDSLDFVDKDNGFAAGANVVYKTGDGGRTWARIFTAPVVTGSNPWQAAIRAGSATNAWFLVYGGDESMSQKAYVLFHTTDGAGFFPVMDEGYFSGAYPSIHLDNNRNIGGQPGTFTVYGDQAAFFTGWYPDQLQLTSTGDDGNSFSRFAIGKSDDTTVPDFFSPMGISFADATHGWLVGSQKGRGIILFTTDGKNFQPVP